MLLINALVNFCSRQNKRRELSGDMSCLKHKISDRLDSALLNSSFRRSPHRAGAGLAVILFHIFLWFILRNGGAALPASSSDQAARTLHASLLPPSPALAARQMKKPATPRLNARPRRADTMPATRLDTLDKSTASSGTASTLFELPSTSPDTESLKESKTLDMDAMKKSARSIATELAPQPLPGASKAMTEAEKFQNAVTQAERGDCRTDHANLGILAIPFLLKDTFTGTGCRW